MAGRQVLFWPACEAHPWSTKKFYDMRQIQTKQQLLYWQGSEWARQLSAKLWLGFNHSWKDFSQNAHGVCVLAVVVLTTSPLWWTVLLSVQFTLENRPVLPCKISDNFLLGLLYFLFSSLLLSCDGDKTGTLCMLSKHSLSIELLPYPFNNLTCSTLFRKRSPRAM